MYKDTSQLAAILANMNVICDALVIVKGDAEGTDWVKSKNGKAIIIFNKVRGLSENRNMDLIDNNVDIVLLVDEDLVYYVEFDERWLKSFADYSEYDFIRFSLDRY